MSEAPPRLRALRFLPAMMFVGGLGLAGYFADQWYRLPTYTEEEIEQSVQMNLEVDLARMGPQLRPQGERLEQLRAMVHAEVVGDINAEREKVQLRFAVGLVAMVFGLGQLIHLRLTQRDP